MQEYIDKLRERYVDQPVKWATLGGLLLLLIGAFGPWVEAEVGPFSASSGGFDENGVFTFILALAGIAAIGAYVYGNISMEQTALLWALVIGAVVVDILVLIDFLDVMTEDEPEGVNISVGWGLWASVIGAIALSVGAILPMWGEIRKRADDMRSSGGSAT